MKKFKFLAMAAAALTFAACSEELVPTPDEVRNQAPESNAITFSTYMGGSRTRAAGDIGGYTGSMTTDLLKGLNPDGTWVSDAQSKLSGFGVFAYYTGTKNYGGDGTNNGYRDNGDKFPNFMYNEHVYWDNANGVWKYDNTKYWPNEFTNSSNAYNEVDDQNNDTSNDPATVVGGENGGNVTFFAYGPWAQNQEASTSNATINGTATFKNGSKSIGATEGIVAISGNAWIGGTGTPTRTGDPYITYVIPTGKETVDLLWGTGGPNSTKANGALQSGQTTGKNTFSLEGDGSETDTENSVTDAAYTNTYANDILKGYTMNDNLNKMNTTGTVNFVFKHALAKLGGSYVGSGEGDDENGNTPTNGLMVILDLDKDGAETGGSLQNYLGGDNVENTPYNTKVTINEIIIESGKQLAEGVNPAAENFVYDETTTAIVDLTNKGTLNLATGRWTNFEATGPTEKTQTISQAESYPVDLADADEAAKDAILSEEIAEPKGFTGIPTGETERTNLTKAGFESLPIGVTTVAKNVYETEAQPFVFLPGSRPILTFTITYTVRTYDPNLKNTYTEVKQKIKKRLYISQTTELNKQYNILMHLGLTSVKFTATVSDWETTAAAGTTTTVEGGSPVTVFDEDIEHVYLPINVAGLILDETPVTTFGSDAGDIVSSASATYHLQEDGQDMTMTVAATNVTFENADGTDLPDWITYSSGKLSVAANETFATRTQAIRAKYEVNTTTHKYIYSENYNIVQYGLTPTAATLTLDPTTPVAAKGGDVTYSEVKVTKYFKTDATGASTGTEQTGAIALTSVDIDDIIVPEWITHVKADSKFTVAANTGAARTGSISVQIGSYVVPADKTISQAAYALDLGTVSSNAFTVKDGDGETVTDATVSCTKDGAVFAADASSWTYTGGVVTLVTADAGTYVFTVTKNNATATQTITIPQP